MYTPMLCHYPSQIIYNKIMFPLIIIIDHLKFNTHLLRSICCCLCHPSSYVQYGTWAWMGRSWNRDSRKKWSSMWSYYHAKLIPINYGNQSSDSLVKLHKGIFPMIPTHILFSIVIHAVLWESIPWFLILTFKPIILILYIPSVGIIPMIPNHNVQTNFYINPLQSVCRNHSHDSPS